MMAANWLNSYPTKPGTPRVGDTDSHDVVVVRARRRPGIHPVVGLDVLLVPYRADLHVGISVDERLLFAVSVTPRLATCPS